LQISTRSVTLTLVSVHIFHTRNFYQQRLACSDHVTFNAAALFILSHHQKCMWMSTSSVFLSYKCFSLYCTGSCSWV